MSYALTSDGNVYAWGDNTDGCLALGHDKTVVDKPEPMMRMQGTTVKKLVVRDCGGSAGKGKTVIAFVELADPLPQKDSIGGFDRPLGETDRPLDLVLSDDMEKDIFEGVDLMRQVMDNTQAWWEDILKIRHGSPYNNNPLQADTSTDKKERNPGSEMRAVTTTPQNEYDIYIYISLFIYKYDMFILIRLEFIYCGVLLCALSQIMIIM